MLSTFEIFFGNFHMIRSRGIILEVSKPINLLQAKNKVRPLFDKQKNSLYQGLMIHIFLC